MIKAKEYEIPHHRIRSFELILPTVLAFTTFLFYAIAHWQCHSIVVLLVGLLLNAVSMPLIVFYLLKQIEHWLREYEKDVQHSVVSRGHLVTLVDVSIDAIFSLTPEGHIESWNLGAEWLLGYLPQEIIGFPLSTLFGNSRSAVFETDWLIQTAKRDRFVRQHETTCRDTFGREIHVELTATAITNDGADKSEGILIILRDITARKKRESEVKRMSDKYARHSDARARELAEKVAELAQANVDLTHLDQTRSEFVSLVSHQIRSPLTNIAGAMQRMQADCGAVNLTCHRMFAILEQQIIRLDSLVSNVLNVTRIEAGELVLQLEPISIVPIVQQVIQQVSVRISTHNIQFTDKPGLPLVFADRDRVAEVLSNLLDNAYKYAPPDEIITVEVRADQNELTIAVRDRGSGVPDEKLRHLFTKFYRVDSGDSQSAYGYGLGLYVCRLLVEQQKGRIWAENHPNGGTVFSFSLPVWES